MNAYHSLSTVHVHVHVFDLPCVQVGHAVVQSLRLQVPSEPRLPRMGAGQTACQVLDFKLVQGSSPTDLSLRLHNSGTRTGKVGLE